MAKCRPPTHVLNYINNYNCRFSSVTRRGFIQQATSGAAGAAFALGGAGSVFAAGNVGHITLDALLITYFGSPLGTSGQVKYTFRPSYSMTLGLRSMNNPAITLRAGVAPEGEGIGQGVWEWTSHRVEGGLTVYPHARTDERYGITVTQPVAPENTAFYGLFRPVLQIKGNESNARFRLVDAGGFFVSNLTRLNEVASEDTANSLRSQYVFDPALLIAPRFGLSISTGVGFAMTATAERKAPLGLTTQTTARIIGQTGFQSEAFKQAFAVGSNLEVTYYAKQDSHGKVLDVDADIQSTSSQPINFYWDRIFRTFVIVPGNPG